VIAERMQK